MRNGGRGGAAGTLSTIEETALALEVLFDAEPDAGVAVNKGLAWLVEQLEAGKLRDAAPIGFYFAKIFSVAALGLARQNVPPSPDGAARVALLPGR